MEVEEAVKYFGTGYKLCQALGIARSNLTHWRKQGYIPYVQQVRLQNLTKTELKANVWRCK